ncbi:MAG TPA: hypothetical protein GYA10_16215 [Alphaproteobacteria bacterium]|nr:hypothetical protein [Alphaproteobacteria bacterium]
MVLTPADILNRHRAADQVYNPVEAEIVAEKASSLGHHGRLVENALAALKSFEGDTEERSRLVRKAAHEVWAFFVQRELCGLRDQREVIRFYGIPQEVLVRLGAMEPRKR